MANFYNVSTARDMLSALRLVEIEVLKQMADGWCIISSQYEKKTWLQKGDERREMPKGVRNPTRIDTIYIYDLIDMHIDNPEIKTVDAFNHTRKYRIYGWRMNHYTAAALKEM